MYSKQHQGWWKQGKFVLQAHVDFSLSALKSLCLNYAKLASCFKDCVKMLSFL